MTPSADELPTQTSIITRLSQNGLVALALFYALVIATTLPLGAFARATIDRIGPLESALRPLPPGGHHARDPSSTQDERAETIQH